MARSGPDLDDLGEVLGGVGGGRHAVAEALDDVAVQLDDLLAVVDDEDVLGRAGAMGCLMQSGGPGYPSRTCPLGRTSTPGKTQATGMARRLPSAVTGGPPREQAPGSPPIPNAKA